MATSTTRLGIRRVQGTDLFKPYSVDLPSIVDTIDAKAVQFNSALAQVQVRDVGEAGQVRAGRVLAPADFTAMGLSAPLGLWNLGTVNDSSGNGRTLTNKGTVPFGPGITGAATEAAVFAGSTAQALYIADTGAADPFRIRTGSWGCWFRTAKRGTQQALLSKWSATAGQAAFSFYVETTNTLVNVSSVTGSDTPSVGGISDVADDRWHFAVVTLDGTRLRLYVDGALEGNSGASVAPMFQGSGPLNIGARSADASTATVIPSYGRVDEAFVTADVLSPEQVLNLYCARVAHTLVNGAGAAVAPTGARIAVRRRKRGGPLVAGDFPTSPVRLHNFTAGSLSDDGSGGVALTSNPGTGAIVSTSGADGANGGAYSFSGAHTGLTATDTGLPATTTARSFGVWFKSSSGAVAQGLIAWGTSGTAMAQATISSSGTIATNSGADSILGPFIADGTWHHVVVVEDNAAADGVKRKLYLDGRLVAGSTVLNSITLVGAAGFKVGIAPGAGSPLIGQIDGAFVYSGALTDVQVRAIYSKGSQALSASSKAEGDHVEALESSGVLAHFDALEGCDLVDLSVVG